MVSTVPRWIIGRLSGKDKTTENVEWSVRTENHPQAVDLDISDLKKLTSDELLAELIAWENEGPNR